MLHSHNKIHFIGIGGIGMSGLAEVLLGLGYQVSGSDLIHTDITHRLAVLGAHIEQGHAAHFVRDDVDMVVHSAAVDQLNPEMLMAHERGIPVITRGELLADITRLKKNVVAVAGSHGKTTTSSMMYEVMKAADLESTAIIGGTLMRDGTSAAWGRGDFLVAETDEHDGSFLKLAPTVSVVTNIDMEHVEYYPDLEALKAAFIEFVHKVPFYGFSVLCVDDAVVKEILPEVTCKTLTYGFDLAADVSAENVQFNDDANAIAMQFDVINRSPRLGNVGVIGRVQMQSLGQHNVLNALAAIATGLGLGIPLSECVQGLQNFQGVRRRMEMLPLANDVTLIEDYAHHPTEIEAVLSVFQESERRKVLVFQPHLYSRTQYFADEFAQVLTLADEVVVLPIYPAREDAIEGIDAAFLVDKMKSLGSEIAMLGPELSEAFSYVCELIQPGDLLFILGAGDVYQLADAFKEGVLSGVC